MKKLGYEKLLDLEDIPSSESTHNISNDISKISSETNDSSSKTENTDLINKIGISNTRLWMREPWSIAVYSGITFCLLFIGYNVVNSFLIILYPDHANIGFGIYYAFYGIFSLLSPYFFTKINFMICFISSAIFFMTFVGFSNSGEITMMIIGCCFSGIGLPLFWLCQAVIVNSITNKDNKGRLNGLFMSIFYTHLVIGNLLGLIVLITKISLNIMLWIMLIPNGIGIIMILMSYFIYDLDKIKSLQKRQFNEKSVSETTSLLDRTESHKDSIQSDGQRNWSLESMELMESRKESDVKSDKIEDDNTNFLAHIGKIFTNPFRSADRGYLIIFMTMGQAIDMNISYQILPKLLTVSSMLIRNNQGNPIPSGQGLDNETSIYNTAMFMAYGLGACVVSLLQGRVFDKLGWKFILFPYILLELLWLILVYLQTIMMPDLELWIWVIIGFFRGLINSIGFTFLTTTIIYVYSSTPKYMLALRQFVFAFSCVIFTISIKFVSYEYIFLMAGIIAIFAAVTYYYFMRFHDVK